MLNDTVQALVAKITGVDAKITELSDKLGAATKTNEDSKSQIEALQNRIGELTASNADLEKRATQAEADLKAANDRVSALEKEKAEIEASVEKRAGLKAAEIAAQQGIPPLDQVPSAVPGASSASSGLRGVARMADAIAKQIDAQK